MKRVVWLSFDLGFDGDYEDLYYWLDSKEAKECGDNIAAFYYEVKEGHDIMAEITSELEKSVKLRTKDRFYMIFRDRDGKFRGKFIIGNRKPAAWEGYARKLDNDDVDG